MNIYCTYLTFYSGNKMPPFYIGSSSVEKVLNGYHGSVCSKKYTTIWDSELMNNPQLFKTRIVSYHETRKEATTKERKFQKELGVVKSPMYINQALATVNGFFGMDVSGELNPMFGKIISEESQAKRLESLKLAGDYHNRGSAHQNYGKKASEETRKKMSLAQKGKRLGMKHSEETKLKVGLSKKGQIRIQSEEEKARRRGVKHSEEHKEKVRQSKLGRKFNKETRKFEYPSSTN